MTGPGTSAACQATVFFNVSDTATTTRGQTNHVGTVEGQAANLLTAETALLAEYDAELDAHMAESERDAQEAADRFYNAHYL
jgi:hypothetical protein